MTEIMVVSSVLLWLAVGFNLILTLALVRRLNALDSTSQSRSTDPGKLAPASPGPEIGQSAPAFTAQTLEGEQVTLNTYIGGGCSAAFVFISTTCEPCREALPSYEALLPKARQAGVELVLVSTSDPVQTAAFVDQFNIRLPVLVAPMRDNPFMKDYNFNATPSYCLVDAQGKIQSAGYPTFSWGEWKALVDSWDQYGEVDEGKNDANKGEGESERHIAGMALSERG